MSTHFNDGKDAGALRTIGEVSAALGIKTHVLRYWEQQFSQLQPIKRSGRRYYRADDIGLLQTIDRLVNREGYTIRGAQQALGSMVINRAKEDYSTGARQGVAEPAPELAGRPETQKQAVPAEIIAELKAIRANLAAALG